MSDFLEILSTISPDDAEGQRKAITILAAQVATVKDESDVQVLIRVGGLQLLVLLAHSLDNAVLRTVASCMAQLIRYESSIDCFSTEEGVQALKGLITSNDEQVVRVALWVTSKIADKSLEAKRLLFDHGILNALEAAAHQTNSSTLQLTAANIAALAEYNDNRLPLLDRNVLAILARLTQEGKDPCYLYVAAALAHLSEPEEARSRIMHEGGFELLFNLIKVPDDEVHALVAHTLVRLSEESGNLPLMVANGAVELLSFLVQSGIGNCCAALLLLSQSAGGLEKILAANANEAISSFASQGNEHAQRLLQVLSANVSSTVVTPSVGKQAELSLSEMASPAGAADRSRDVRSNEPQQSARLQADTRSTTTSTSASAPAPITASTSASAPAAPAVSTTASDSIRDKEALAQAMQQLAAVQTSLDQRDAEVSQLRLKIAAVERLNSEQEQQLADAAKIRVRLSTEAQQASTRLAAVNDEFQTYKQQHGAQQIDTAVRQAVSEKDTQIEDLRKQLADLRASSDRGWKDQDRVAQQVISKDLELDRIARERDDVLRDRERMQEQYRDANSKLEDALIHAEHQASESKIQVVQLQAELETVRQQLIAIQSDLRQRDLRIQVLEQDAQNLSVQHSEGASRAAVVDREIEQLKFELKRARADYDRKCEELERVQAVQSSTGQRRDELADRVRRSQTQLGELEAAVASLSKDKSDLLAQIEIMNLAMRRHDETVAQLTSEVTRVNKALSDVELERAVLADKAASLQMSEARNMEELRDAGRRLQTVQDDSQHELERVRARVLEITQELSDSRDHIAILRREVGARDMEMEKLQTEILDARKGRDEQARARDLAAEQLRHDVGADQVSKLRERVAELDNLLQRARSENMQLASEASDLKQQMANHVRTISDKTGRLAVLERELDEANRHVATLEKTNTQLRIDSERERERLVTGHAKELDALNEHLTASQAAQRQAEERARMDGNVAHSQLAELENELERVKRQVVSLESQLQRERSTNELASRSTESARVKAESALKERDAQLTELTLQHRELQQRAAASNVNMMHGMVQSLAEQLSAKQSQVEELTSERNLLSSQLQTAQHSLRERTFLSGGTAPTTAEDSFSRSASRPTVSAFPPIAVRPTLVSASPAILTPTPQPPPMSPARAPPRTSIVPPASTSMQQTPTAPAAVSTPVAAPPAAALQTRVRIQPLPGAPSTTTPANAPSRAPIRFAATDVHQKSAAFMQEHPRPSAAVSVSTTSASKFASDSAEPKSDVYDQLINREDSLVVWALQEEERLTRSKRKPMDG